MKSKGKKSPKPHKEIFMIIPAIIAVFGIIMGVIGAQMHQNTQVRAKYFNNVPKVSTSTESAAPLKLKLGK